jgi:hypothetical protein
LYGHHHTGLGALLLAITALFTRILRFLVHNPHPVHVPGWQEFHRLINRLGNHFPDYRDLGHALLRALRQFRNR